VEEIAVKVATVQVKEEETGSEERAEEETEKGDL
jgi:hypothetical protein